MARSVEKRFHIANELSRKSLLKYRVKWRSLFVFENFSSLFTVFFLTKIMKHRKSFGNEKVKLRCQFYISQHLPLFWQELSYDQWLSFRHTLAFPQTMKYPLRAGLDRQ